MLLLPADSQTHLHQTWSSHLIMMKSILVLGLLLVAHFHTTPGVQGAHTMTVCDLNDIQIVTDSTQTVDGRWITTVKNNCHLPVGCEPRNIRFACWDYNPTNVVPAYLIYRKDGNGPCIINDGQPLIGEIQFSYKQAKSATFTQINADYPCCLIY